MPKRPLKIRFRIPPYPPGRRLEWRRAVHAAAEQACHRANVAYSRQDRLEVQVRLYMANSLLGFNDVDNRAKDILDALQGRIGGPKRIRQLAPLIPNDNQVYRLLIEKALPPKQSAGLGHVLVRRISRGAS